MAIFVSGERNMLDQIDCVERGKKMEMDRSQKFSTWLLKSPVRTNSCGAGTAMNRKESKSSR